MSTNIKKNAPTTNIKNATKTKTGTIGTGTTIFLALIFSLDIYGIYKSFKRESEISSTTNYSLTGIQVFIYVFCLIPIISLIYSALHFKNRPSGKSIGFTDIFLGANIVQTLLNPQLFIFAIFYVFLLLPLLAFIL